MNSRHNKENQGKNYAKRRKKAQSDQMYLCTKQDWYDDWRW